MKYAGIGVLAASLLAFGPAHADITAGVFLSMTGPAAVLGKATQNTIALFPKEIGGQKINYIFLDNATDPTMAVKNAKKLIAEHNVDVLIGPSITPSALAAREVAAAAKVPEIAIVPSVAMPVTDKSRWTFSTPDQNPLMAAAATADMAKRGVKKAAFIGFSDAFGDLWLHDFSATTKDAGIEIVASERFARSATSVTGQALHIKAAAPDAVMIVASGTPAALPVRALREVGYKGLIYETQAAANPDFLRVCGADCEGVIVPVAPGFVADQLPDSNPFKAAATEFFNTYETAYGKGSVSQFAADSWGAAVLLEHAIPVALKTADPSDKVAFRAALRDALEGVSGVPAPDGMFQMSATNHGDLAQGAAVTVQIKDGHWKLLQ